MAECEIRAPQFYRWRNGNEEWHYTASGMPEALARETYRHPGSGFLDGVTKISFGSRYDACLPPCKAGDRERIADLLREAATLNELRAA